MEIFRTLILMSKYAIFLLAGIFLSNCTAYYSAFPEDGIYTRKVAEIYHDNGVNHYRSSKSSYYKNYFNHLAEQENYVDEGDVITDTENYSSYQSPEDNHSSYQSYGPLGSNPRTTNIYIQSYPYYSGFSHWGYPRNRGFFRGYRSFSGFYYPTYPYNLYHTHSYYSPYYSEFSNFNHWYGHYYSPYFGYNHGYSHWRPNRRWWRNYSWDDWSSRRYFTPRHSRGYNAVSFSNSRRGESKSKERRIRIREPKSSVKRNSLPSSIVFSRLQAGRSTSTYYNSNEAVRNYHSSYRNRSEKATNSSKGRNSSNLSSISSGNQKRIKTKTPSYYIKSRSVGRNSSRHNAIAKPNSARSKSSSNLSSVRDNPNSKYTSNRRERRSYSTAIPNGSKTKKTKVPSYQKSSSNYRSSYDASTSKKSSKSNSYKSRTSSNSNLRSSVQKSSTSRTQSNYQPSNNVQRSYSGRSSSSSVSRSYNKSSSSARSSRGRSRRN